MSHPVGLAIVFGLLLSVPALAVEPPVDRDANALRIINTRLDPVHRDRTLKVWNDAASRPDVRAQLATSLEQYETKLKPDWTGLGIAAGTVGLPVGIAAGVLATKLGAAGLIAGPVGVVAGVAAGALIAYSIHTYHQRKALEGGIFSRSGRRLGFKGKGLEGDLLRAEEALTRPPPPSRSERDPQPPAQPSRRHWWSLRRTPVASPTATTPRAPGQSTAVPSVAVPPPAAALRRGPADDLNTDDIRNTP